GFEGGQLLLLRINQPLVTVTYPQGAIQFDGTLVVLGTSGDDAIRVRKQGGNIVVVINGQFMGAFDAATLSAIKINGYAGDDTISVAPSITLPATVYGGEGRDKIEGGGGNDLIDGGPDSDTLRGRGGNNVFVLTPGEGTDTVLDFGDGSDKIKLDGNLAF